MGRYDAARRDLAGGGRTASADADVDTTAASPDATAEPAIDETAQRLLNLFFVLNAAPRPLTTDEIIRDSDLGYGSPNRASDLRKFRRDREKLAARGVFVAEVRTPGASETEESSWTIDRAQTFAAGGIVRADDARQLIGAIDAYLRIPGSPFGTPLHAIRGKAVEALVALEGVLPEELEADESEQPRTSAGSARANARGTTSSAAPDPARAAITDALWTAFSLRRAIPIRYVNAGGTASRRTVCIYGIFSRAGAGYIAALDDASGEVRTFRIDRIARAGALRGSYRIPAGFDVRNRLFLPFDLADADTPEVLATFSFPAERTAAELAAITLGRGELTQQAEPAPGWTWHIGVRNVDAAASFALAHARDGIRPVAPQELVSAWRARVAQVVSAHGN